MVLLPSVSGSEADNPFWCAGGDGRVNTGDSWVSEKFSVSSLGDKGDGGTIPFTLSAQLFPGLKCWIKNN